MSVHEDTPSEHPSLSTLTVMEIDCRAWGDDAEITLVVEPWAEEIPVPTGSALRLVLEGEPSEAMGLFWMPEGLLVYPPRYSVLSVQTRSGEEVRRFDTRELPPTPPAWTPQA